ncbi:MAG: NAD(P)/FAD-dependent oxidoreductase, partial [Kaistella sp.]
NILINLCENPMNVTGKSTYKDEFVTAGGVELKEIDFKNMSSKVLNNFYIAGEVLNIDAVTGGFNFQACWSEAWLMAQDLNSK